MKLLFDENLSDRLIASLADLFPGSTHVKLLGQTGSDDTTVWQFARDRGFVLVSKDRDFQQLSAVRGAPPKVIWLRVGNRSTQYLADLLRENTAALRDFESRPEALLIIANDPTD